MTIYYISLALLIFTFRHGLLCFSSDFPPCFASFRYYDIVRDVRQNKGSILKASVEYIRKLKSDQHKKRLMEEKLKQQDAQNKKLLLKIQVKICTFSRTCLEDILEWSTLIERWGSPERGSLCSR